MIGVKIRVGGHGQDAAGVHIHDHTHRRAPDLVVVVGDLQILFQIVLQHLVDGEYQGLPLLGGVIKLIIIRDGVASCVGETHRPPRCPGENVVIFLFQPGEPLLVGAHAAQYLAEEAAIGVIPGGILFEIEGSGELVFLYKGADLVGHVLFHPPAEDLVGAVLGHLALELFLVQGEEGDELFGDEGHAPLPQVAFVPVGELDLGILRILSQALFLADISLFRRRELAELVGSQLAGVEDEHLRAGGDGQGLAVDVIDGPPGGIDGHIPGLAGQGLLLVKIRVDELEPRQAGDDRSHAHHAEERRHHQDAAADMKVGFPLKSGHKRSFWSKKGDAVASL